jgi:hypothetical protein
MVGRGRKRGGGGREGGGGEGAFEYACGISLNGKEDCRRPRKTLLLGQKKAAVYVIVAV